MCALARVSLCVCVCVCECVHAYVHACVSVLCVHVCMRSCVYIMCIRCVCVGLAGGDREGYVYGYRLYLTVRVNLRLRIA